MSLCRTLIEVDFESHLPDLGKALHILAVRLLAAGRGEESREAINEAVGIRRVLAQENPYGHLSGLGDSMEQLSIILWAVGRRQEGVVEIQRTIGLRRTLAEADPALFTEDLENALLRAQQFGVRI